VTDVQLNLHNSGTLNVVFQDKCGEDATGRSCQLGLQSALLHGLLHLLQQAMQKANWRMETPLPVDVTDALEPTKPVHPVYVH
jgi:hypothetical protein